MTAVVSGEEMGVRVARSRALAVLRVRGRALAAALLPAALCVILFVAGATDRLTGAGWDAVRWGVAAVAAVALLCAAGVGLVVARARPAVSPTVAVPEGSAPDLYRLVRDLADRLGVPAPSAIALTPDCDSWLEDRTHRAHGRPVSDAPVLVIGSPFLWWMRVTELRAVLAPVVAGTGPSAHPDIAAARRFVRGLDAALAVSAAPGRGPLGRAVFAGVGWVTRLMLRACRVHAAELERGVAAAAAERAQAVDYGLRIAAQEQVGLAYAGWDRLLTKVALPAWRMGRWPSRLDAGVVSALTELSRRDRLADGFASRLGERPACDLLDEPGAVDEAASLLAARIFHGGPGEAGPGWSPVDWQQYPEEVVDRKWRSDAARLHRVLDSLAEPLGFSAGEGGNSGGGYGTSGGGAEGWTGPRTGEQAGAAGTGEGSAGGSGAESDAGAPVPYGPTLARVVEHLTLGSGSGTGSGAGVGTGPVTSTGPGAGLGAGTGPRPTPSSPNSPSDQATSSPTPVQDSVPGEPSAPAQDSAHGQQPAPGQAPTPGQDPAPTPDPEAAHTSALDPDADPAPHPDLDDRASLIAAGLSAELAREEAHAPRAGSSAGAAAGPGADGTYGPPSPAQADAEAVWWGDGMMPLFPLQAPRTARELLADHVRAMVCCAAVDTAGGAPGLDWLDGPSLLIDGERDKELGPLVLTLVEDGDPEPLTRWLARRGIRADKPVRLV